MSGPHDSAKPDADEPARADDALPPFDAELTLGADGPGMVLPEPVLGQDEDGAPDFGLADEAPAERSPFLANLQARAETDDDAPAALDDLPPELAAADMSFDAADADELPAFAAEAPIPDLPTDDGPIEHAPSGNGMAVTTPSAMVETVGRMRRVWQEIRLQAIVQAKPVVEPPPPVIDDRGRTIRKYLFEKSFDIVEAVPEPEPEPEPIIEEPPPVELIGEEPPPPTFSEEELAAARAAGYADGETTAGQAAATATETRIAGLVEQLAGIIPGLAADRDQAIAAVSQEAARLAHAMVRRLMPEIARRYRLEELEAVVIDSLDKALDQPRIIIRTPADVTAYLGDRLETVARQYGFAGRVIVLADQTLGPSDVRVEWGDGGAERCVQRAWNDLEAVVGRVIDKLEQVAPVADIPAGAPGDTIGSAA
jgi:flagellar assembly protein FliH